ncbi:MAG: hypothetical protein Q4G28_02630 [Neisseria sp.]|nr:hypothetical protein [Neisseria sp.]
MSFLVWLGWSVAYVHGWAQAYYYGFPWELVEIGMPNIARSLGYVLFLSLIIGLLYTLGVAAMRIAKRCLPRQITAPLRIFIWSAIVSGPILVQIFLFMKRIDYVFIAIYLLFAACLSAAFQTKVKTLNPNRLIRQIKSKQINLLILIAGSYLYFTASAFMVGYYRPMFRTTYPSVEIRQAVYYVLVKSNTTLVLAQNTSPDNRIFFVAPCRSLNQPICRIKMARVAKPFH